MIFFIWMDFKPVSIGFSNLFRLSGLDFKPDVLVLGKARKESYRRRILIRRGQLSEQQRSIKLKHQV